MSAVSEVTSRSCWIHSSFPVLGLTTENIPAFRHVCVRVSTFSQVARDRLAFDDRYRQFSVLTTITFIFLKMLIHSRWTQAFCARWRLHQSMIFSRRIPTASAEQVRPLRSSCMLLASSGEEKLKGLLVEKLQPSYLRVRDISGQFSGSCIF